MRVRYRKLVDRVVVGTLIAAGALHAREATNVGKAVPHGETLDQYLRYVTRWKKAGRPMSDQSYRPTVTVF